MHKKKIIIIGAGITGLSLAFKLAKSGHDVTVCEKREKTIGGLAGTFRSGQFYFDYGPHEFCTDNPELIEHLEDILGTDLLSIEKSSAQFFNNKYIPYPFTIKDLILSFNIFFLLKVGFEVTLSRLTKLLGSTHNYSFEKWVKTRFGKTLYNSYFGPYTKKVWGIDPDLLDARTASDRIAFNSIFDYLIKALNYFILGKDDYSNIHSALKKRFFYSKYGIGTISEKLFKRCQELEVKFNFNHTLKEIISDNSILTKLIFNNEQIIEGFDHCVSTIPLTSLLSANGNYNDNILIKFRSIIFVFIEIPKRDIIPYHWTYFPDKDICFQRLTNFSLFSSSMAPKDSTGLCAEISCFTTDKIWNDSDDVTIDKVRQDLESVSILSTDILCKAHVVKQEFGYPVQVNGYPEIIKSLLNNINDIKNLSTIGRQGLYKYCNMNECIEMSFSLAKQINNNENNFMQFLEPRWKGAGLEDKDHY